MMCLYDGPRTRLDAVAVPYAVGVLSPCPDYLAMLAAAGVERIEVTYNMRGASVSLPAGELHARTPDVTAALLGINATESFDDVIDALPVVSVRRLGETYMLTKAIR